MVTATLSASDQIWDQALSPNQKINIVDLTSKNIWHSTFETIYDDDKMVLNIMEAMIYIRKHMKFQYFQKSENQPPKNHIFVRTKHALLLKIDFL